MELDRMVAKEGRDKGRATSNVNALARCQTEWQVQVVRASRFNIIRPLWRGQKEGRDGTCIIVTPSQASS